MRVTFQTATEEAGRRDTAGPPCILLHAAHPEKVMERTGSMRDRGVLVTPVGDGLEALDQLRGGGYDGVLVEMPAPGWDNAELLEELQRASPGIPIVVLEGEPTEDLDGAVRVAGAVRLLKLGAFHYLPDGVDPERLACVVESALERRRSLLPQQVHEDEPWRRTLIGESPAMQRVADVIRLIGSRRSTVLITGETGTGKEMAARAIHMASARSHLAMVAVNCSALPENLLEAELFGHVKGAFTGAFQNRVGRFEQANRSTLFLDEIGEMPLDLQAKLLRVLQEREFQRLGSSDTVRVDVRVIAASNIDLGERVKQGRFREDLYYRINVVPIVMPALRDRRVDIPLLTRHFIDKICRQEEIAEKHAERETLERLCRYHWPGNVRQLENAVEMAVALCGPRSELLPGDFPLPSIAETRRNVLQEAPHIPVPDEGLDFEAIVGRIEWSLLNQALRKSGGNKKLAADMLGLKRTTLAAKLKSLEAGVPVRAAG